ncbi:MAG TPA: hypothetical protein VJN96_06720 [Vicinamibacterales bacterium]|nr:hypothetical protein [Vicinamibacterales bacterium]
MTRRLPHLFAALCLAACTIAPATAAAQGSPQQVYAIVVDSDGWPVRGLSAEDFSLRDGAVRQAVLSAEPATNPVWTAVVVRGFERGELPAVRRAIEALAKTTRTGAAGSRTGVMRASSSGSSWTEVTADMNDAAWNALVANSAGSIVDAIGDACTALRNAPTDRRAVVTILKRRPDDASVKLTGLVTDTLFNAGAALWTIEMPSSAGSPAPAPAAGSAKLDDVLNDATKFSGALRERVNDAAELAPMAERVGHFLFVQYIVTYLWPNPMLSTFSIATRHDRGEVLVPAWAR